MTAGKTPLNWCAATCRTLSISMLANEGVGAAAGAESDSRGLRGLELIEASVHLKQPMKGGRRSSVRCFAEAEGSGLRIHHRS
jgi:hypothetical protein